jgi:ribonuclease-3
MRCLQRMSVAQPPSPAILQRLPARPSMPPAQGATLARQVPMPHPADDSAGSLEPSRASELAVLAARIGHEFRDVAHLQRALCHASTGNEKKVNYERLEFLGDAILNFLVAEQLFRHRPEIPVGELTELRARLVARQPLALVAVELQLGAALEGGRGLREQDRSSPRILADLVEAVLGAVYVDGGIDAATLFVQRWILSHLGRGDAPPVAGARRQESDPALRADPRPRPADLRDPRGVGPAARQDLRGRLAWSTAAWSAAPTARVRQFAEKAAAAAGLAMLQDAEAHPSRQEPPA